MDRLNNLANYFNEKERKRLAAKAKENSLGIPEMTAAEVKLSCMENNGYETPELNDKLYLHFRGFRKIENLDAYTGCKSIWLDSNGFNKIENLEALTQLRCLYLAKNLISKIEGLNTLASLTILDLSNNRLSTIENLSCCPMLQTINFSHNALSSPASISHLTECLSITNIDVTNNRLEADEEFFEVLKAIPAVVTLSINGNEITKLPTFRKRMISLLPKLGYLDRPIDEQERLFAEAFVRGGAEAETVARADWKTKQAEKRVNEMNEFKAWQQEQKRLREQARAEGRSLIKELTPEEIATRAAEAQAAADAEKEMLSLGVSNLAAKFWQGDGQQQSESSHGITGLRNNRTVDPLDIAAQRLQNERNQQKAIEASPVVVEASIDANDIDLELTDTELPSQTEPIAAVASNAGAIPAEERMPLGAEESKGGDEEVRQPSHAVVEVEKPTAHETTVDVKIQNREAHDAEDANDNDSDEVETTEVESQDVRDRRVAESFAIYKRQLDEQKLRGPGYSNQYMQSSTWNAAAAIVPATSAPPSNKTENSHNGQNPIAAEPPKKRPLYWSETMDVELGKLVKECVFDFDLISEKMIAIAETGGFKDGPAEVKKTPRQSLSGEECRLRWSQLDASVWSDVSLTPTTSALDTVFKICINPAVLGAAHGAQPSFQALASIAAGSKPNYLTVPTSFPSVQDIKEEDVDSDLDLD
eukprot:gene27756-36581_t